MISPTIFFSNSFYICLSFFLTKTSRNTSYKSRFINNYLFSYFFFYSHEIRLAQKWV